MKTFNTNLLNKDIDKYADKCIERYFLSDNFKPYHDKIFDYIWKINIRSEMINEQINKINSDEYLFFYYDYLYSFILFFMRKANKDYIDRFKRLLINLNNLFTLLIMPIYVNPCFENIYFLQKINYLEKDITINKHTYSRDNIIKSINECIDYKNRVNYDFSNFDLFNHLLRITQIIITMEDVYSKIIDCNKIDYSNIDIVTKQFSYYKKFIFLEDVLYYEFISNEDFHEKGLSFKFFNDIFNTNNINSLFDDLTISLTELSNNFIKHSNDYIKNVIDNNNLNHEEKYDKISSHFYSHVTQGIERLFGYYITDNDDYYKEINFTNDDIKDYKNEFNEIILNSQIEINKIFIKYYNSLKQSCKSYSHNLYKNKKVEYVISTHNVSYRKRFAKKNINTYFDKDIELKLFMDNLKKVIAYSFMEDYKKYCFYNVFKFALNNFNNISYHEIYQTINSICVIFDDIFILKLFLIIIDEIHNYDINITYDTSYIYKKPQKIPGIPNECLSTSYTKVFSKRMYDNSFIEQETTDNLIKRYTKHLTHYSEPYGVDKL